MRGYLKEHSPALQFVTFISLFIAFFLLNFILLLVFFPMLTGYTLDTLQNGDTSDPKVLGYLKLTQFLYTLLVYLMPAAVFAWLADPKPAQWLDLGRKPRLFPVVLAIFIMVAALPLVGFSADWNHTWHFSAATRASEKMAEELTRALLSGTGIGSLIINLVLIAIMPAIAEEFFFRGVLQRIFVNMIPKLPWLAVLGTAVLFSAVHMQWMDFIPRIILGFLLGAIYFLSGNLWLSILAHMLNNGSQVVMVFLYTIKVMKEDPMKSEPTAWYFALISLTVTTGLLWYFKKQSPRDQLPGLPPRDKISDSINSIGGNL